MSTTRTTNLPELVPWQVGDLRLTAFPSILAPSGVVPDRAGWEELVGRKPAISRTSDGEVEESGPVEFSAVLSHRRSPWGIQWILSGSGGDKSESLLMNPQALRPFMDLMRRWLMTSPPLRRLAFGAALYLPVKDRLEAYRRLEGFLHLGLKYSDEEGDFLYQYNRRRPSETIPGVKLNRLSKWTWVPLGDVRAEDGKLVFPKESACLLELDINTVPEFSGILPQDGCAPLFEEMVGLAAQIAAQGDVP